MTEKISVNERAFKILTKMLDDPDYYKVHVTKTESGTTLIDAGVSSEGGFEAGRLITEVCMGGCASVHITTSDYGCIEMPAAFVYSDHPVVATLGSQYAGWQIKEDGYFAIGSGPARALAQRPRKIFDSIIYMDDFGKAVMVLEADRLPPDGLLKRFADDCHVLPADLYVIVAATTSIAGGIQIVGRSIETGIHKLRRLGFDMNVILHGWGLAPIPPVHPDFAQAMGRTNDALLYGGQAGFVVRSEDESELQRILGEAPSSTSRDYGRPFIEVLKRANGDFYGVDPNLFAPAIVVISNVKTGNTFRKGEINSKALFESFGLT